MIFGFKWVSNLIELNDVLMPDELQDVDLSGHPLYIGHLHDTLLLQNFDGHFFLSDLVHGRFHFAKGSFALGLP